jgi:hypothetical protein
MSMMPWRDQAKILLWPFWDTKAPLWVNIVLRIAQAIIVIAFVRGSAWIFAAGIALIIAGTVTEKAVKNKDKDKNRRQQ